MQYVTACVRFADLIGYLRRNKQYMKKVLFLLLLTLSVGVLSGCKAKPVESVSGTGFYFDTFCTFTVYGTEDESIIEDLKAECLRYEKVFSTTNYESELYRLNHGETNEVSEDLYECVSRALSLCSYSKGHYDISIRPISRQWSFTQYDQCVPDKESIDEGLKRVNYSDVILKADDGKYRIEMANDMQLDLGSVAKGYIADRLGELLMNKGIKSAVISLGGNVKCLGSKPAYNDSEEYTPFRIAVKSPFAGEDGSNEGDNGYADIVYIKDMSVVTSGIYERGFEKDGVFYHHLLDAKTGYPVENDLASVTIITESSYNADLLSTVCFLLDYDKTVELKNAGIIEDFEAEFIYKDRSVRRTEGFEKYIKTE